MFFDCRGEGSSNRNTSRDESVEAGDKSVEAGDESIEAGEKTPQSCYNYCLSCTDRRMLLSKYDFSNCICMTRVVTHPDNDLYKCTVNRSSNLFPNFGSNDLWGRDLYDAMVFQSTYTTFCRHIMKGAYLGPLSPSVPHSFADGNLYNLSVVITHVRTLVDAMLIYIFSVLPTYRHSSTISSIAYG